MFHYSSIERPISLHPSTRRNDHDGRSGEDHATSLFFISLHILRNFCSLFTMATLQELKEGLLLFVLVTTNYRCYTRQGR